MTSVTAEPRASGFQTPGFTSQLRAEWTKIRSVRSFYVEVLLSLGLAIVMTALICVAIGSSFDQLSAAEQADFDPVLIGFFGSSFSGIVLIVLGVTFTSSEYTSGMVRLSFAATPQRGRWLAAKALIVLLVTLITGLLVTFLGFFISQAVLGNYDGVPTASFSDAGTQEAIVAGWLTTPMWPLIGTAIGTILRSTASAITSTMVLLFAPAFFGGLAPRWHEENVLAYLPGNAADSLLAIEESSTGNQLEKGVAVVVIVVWLAVFYGVAYGLLKRRDV